MYYQQPIATKKHDYLLSKTNPGISFTIEPRQLKFPDNHSQSYFCDANLTYHFASKTQKLYSPFQNSYYLPPHLNSSKVHGSVFKGQCAAWKVRKSQNYHYGKENQKSKQIRGRHIENMSTNYDNQYRIYEQKVKTLPRKNYHCIKPRIKYLVEQDRPQKPTKINYQSEEESDQGPIE